MKKISKAIVKIFVAFLLIVIVYLIMISFPQVFFNSRQFENLKVYHHGNADVTTASEKALAKIKKSSLYNPNSEYEVFLTDSDAEHTFFTSIWRGSYGVYLLFANGNIFIRPSLIEQDRLIKPDGNLVAEDRPLNYFIAHEVAHAMEYEKLGFSKYNALNQWVREGIADHIGRDKFDFDEMLENYRNNLPLMDYKQSGLYLEYQLLVEYKFKYKAANPESLLEENPSETEVKNEMQNLTK
ncbi:MAG: hypothetical protein H0X15_02795 [Acidobacteria bacterium]|nr:hypothetical protein [Acidobacteriota bacterium]MBA4120927.1 hypothetical protein [Acidobacteriota bacterium]